MDFKSTIEFLNSVNQAVYGVRPFKENDSERQDEGELTPEELQERADEAREQV